MTDRDRSIELFKKIEYTPFPEMTMKSNLGNQFTDYALNCIVDEILANGVIVPPCKVGQIVWLIRTGKIEETTVEKIVLKDGGLYLKLLCNSFYETTCRSIGKTVFLTKEEAEEKLKELKENG